MRCPTLSELPPPPPGKTGWPWTMESQSLPDQRPDKSPWPRFSIVTPSFNQAAYLEETIRSVLLQSYPDVEYVVMDGGSTDGSLEIIEKYSRWIAFWQSRSDGGQAAAINAGFTRATGSVFAWINSDDGYLPQGLMNVAAAFEPRVDIVIGNTLFKGGGTGYYVQTSPIRLAYLDRGGIVPQHATFWRSQRNEATDERIQCAFDFDLWLRMFPKARRIVQVPYAVAYVNMHDAQKSTSKGWERSRESDSELIERKHPKSWLYRRFTKKFLDRVYYYDFELQKLLAPGRDKSEVFRAVNLNDCFDDSVVKLFRNEPLRMNCA